MPAPKDNSELIDAIAPSTAGEETVSRCLDSIANFVSNNRDFSDNAEMEIVSRCLDSIANFVMDKLDTSDDVWWEWELNSWSLKILDSSPHHFKQAEVVLDIQSKYIRGLIWNGSKITHQILY